MNRDSMYQAKRLAEKALSKSYSPYSKFAVGACIVGEGGFYTGTNVENISFGLTMCAERVAVGSAIANGEKGFTALVLVAKTKEPVVPCGACRQVLAEFNDDLSIISWTTSGACKSWKLRELLPAPRQGILDRE